jgi:hypothetical protein
MDGIPLPLPEHPVRFMDELRAFMQARHLAYRTEKTYCTWILDFIRFHKRRHLSAMGAAEVEEWCSYLANRRSVAVNTKKKPSTPLPLCASGFLTRR